MGQVSKGPGALVCRHLGLANDPFLRNASPSEEHRCYLWMQRELIDLAHQSHYCLSGHCRNCPWRQIGHPSRSILGRDRGEGLASTLSEGARWIGRALAAFLVAVVKRAGSFRHWRRPYLTELPQAPA